GRPAVRPDHARVRPRLNARPPSSSPAAPRIRPSRAMVRVPPSEPADVCAEAATAPPAGAEAVAPAGVRVSTGAGWSGSGCPATVGSIHRTTDPSEYVWSALNVIVDPFGSGPSDTGNSWNWPGW